MLRKKIFRPVAIALLIAFMFSTVAMAATPNNTIFFGEKAYNLSLLKDPTLASEIAAAFVANGNKFVYKTPAGSYIDINANSVEPNVIPAGTYMGEDGKTVGYGAGDTEPVQGREVVEATDIDETVKVDDDYTLPATVTVKLSDDTTKDLAVNWDNPADTSIAGEFTFVGDLVLEDGITNPDVVQVYATLVVKPVTDVLALRAINPTTILVTFNNEVTAEAAAKANYTVSKGTLEAATKTSDKEVSLAVAELTYGDEVTVTITDPAFTQAVIIPKVDDLYQLVLTTDAPNDTIKSDGATKTQITVTLKEKKTDKVVDKDGIVQFQATDGGLGQTTSALVDGKATIQLTSVASAISITSILTATISDVPGAQEFKGLSAQKAIIFSPTPVEEGQITFVTAVDAESTQGDRFFVTFSGNITASAYKAAAKTLGNYGINIDGKPVEIEDVLQETDNTLMFILDTDRAAQTRIEKGWSGTGGGNGNYLRDNVTHNVSFPSDIGNLVKANLTGIDFILTDTSRPGVLGVTAKDQLEFSVRFTESVDRSTVIPANFLIDGRAIELNTSPTPAQVVAAKNDNKIILTALAAGIYDTTKTPIDQRNIVNFKIYKDFALTPGLHQIQVANVGDWAQDVDPAQNIVATDTFDFNVIADVSIPVPRITVQSAEQWRVDFDKKVYGVTGKKIKDVFAIKSADANDSFVMETDYIVSTIDEKGDTGTLLKSNDYASTLNGEQYFLIEFTKDWTVKYDTAKNPLKTYFASTKNPYVVTINNVESLVGNKMSKKDLNVTLSYDGVSPTIVEAEQLKNNVAVTMSEPVKKVYPNAEGLTPSQQQLADEGVPVPTYEFVKGDKVVEATAISFSYDDYRFVLKPVTALDAGEWTLYIRSISDDIGNTSATVSKVIVIEAVAAKPTDTQIAWAAFDDAAGLNKLINDEKADDFDVIYVKFTKVMKSDGADGVSRTQNYVFMGQPLPDGSQVLKGIKGVTNNWDGVTILMDKNTWNGVVPSSGGVNKDDFTVALNIASNFKSSEGELLSGRYEVELTDTDTTVAALKDGFEAMYLANTANTFSGAVVVKGAEVNTSTADGKIDTIVLKLDAQGAKALPGASVLVNGKKFDYSSISANDVTFNAASGNEITGTATNNLEVTALNGSVIVNTGSVEDKAEPKIIKADLDSDKKKLTLTFSEPVTRGIAATAGTFVGLEKIDFALALAGTATVDSVNHEESAPNIVVLTVANGGDLTTASTIAAATTVRDFANNAADTTAFGPIAGAPAGETVAVTGVSLDKAKLNINKGDTTTLIATIAPANASEQGVNWSTTDANVAMVADGVVTAVAAGTAIITVTTVDGSFTADCKVVVNEEGTEVKEIAGELKRSMFGDYAEFDMPAGTTAIESATLNGETLDADIFEYAVDNNKGIINGANKATDEVFVTINGVEYQIKFQ